MNTGENWTTHSITVKVQGDKAIVRLMQKNTKTGELAKWGLTLSGKWLNISEGGEYPPECLLSAEHYKDGYRV